ncbi:ABC transporter ATP-binding protein [Parablautia muri]|uniref:ABC transporter ATP-binding protein n=1 Tax=Parablautia muri TaxID=2320879 RepID=A0A9X5BGY1_9FIRM|nr:ABC transporter ATP-binding protein [Parablautia muri]NBJ93901.1 ABC transporter ATP-binding protein [Parablautia muri]
MWKYIKPYLLFGILAGLFMVGEVSMDLIQPGIMSQIVDDGVLGLHNNGVGDLTLIWKLGIGMIGLVLLGGLSGAFNNAFVHLTGQNIGNDMRKDCFRNVMGFSFPQIDEYGTGTLVTRVTNDITQVQNFVSQFVRGMIRTIMLTFGSMYCIFKLNRDFGLITVCAFPFIAGCLVFCLHKANPLFSRLQAQLDAINEIMQEDISGIRTIKACVRETYEKLRFGRANDGLIQTQLKVLVIFAFMNPVVNAMMYLVVAAILLIGSFEAGSGRATPGNIMAAVTYTTQLLNGVLMLTMLFQNISRGYASWKRVKEILDSKPELKDGSFCGETEKKGEIEFRDVSFSYPHSGKMVLEHVNFTVHQGEKVAVLGATGCGKSSLVNLIPRFYDVVEGTVLVDGVDVREYKQKDLREKVAVVLQKSELFSTSIGGNIAWGKPDAAPKEVKAAAIIAQADDFIRQKNEGKGQSGPEGGYETIVAERGMSLSGGQKQRLSIARAVLKPAEILILDDSTSALDLKTESDFYKALEEFGAKSTKIIIAQRIASVRGADRILVMENGRILEEGSHEELLKSCKVYQEIYRSQIGKEDEKIA